VIARKEEPAMKISREPWDTAVAFIGVGVLVVIMGILVHRFTRRPEVFARIAQADRVVVYEQAKPELRITYTGVELSQIIEAIQNSRRDRRLYDTPVGIYLMDFYKGEVKVATVPTCSCLFRADGKQYRTADGTLERLVDTALHAARQAYRKAREQNEKGP